MNVDQPKISTYKKERNQSIRPSKNPIKSTNNDHIIPYYDLSSNRLAHFYEINRGRFLLSLGQKTTLMHFHSPFAPDSYPFPQNLYSSDGFFDKNTYFQTVVVPTLPWGYNDSACLDRWRLVGRYLERWFWWKVKVKS